MAKPLPLHFVFYIAATPEKVWEGFVSAEANRIIFTGAELEADLKPGGYMHWVGPGPDGNPAIYVRSEILRYEPAKLLQYTFVLGQSEQKSRVTVKLVRETEATQVTVIEATQVTLIQDEWTEDDPGYASCADGWPRILSRLKTLIETGKTFRPH
jgi:uncharacterized protein YndB with AHSA1/START domain